jgi:hypothetical protein
LLTHEITTLKDTAMTAALLQPHVEDTDLALARTLVPLYQPDWTVQQRLALLIALVGRLTKEGEFDGDAGHWRFLQFDDVRARINPLAYRCGVLLEYSDPSQTPTEIVNVDGRERAQTWGSVRAVNYNNPQDVTNWASSLGLCYPADAADDKFTQKSQSQALKYATTKFLNISSGEPDADSAFAKDRTGSAPAIATRTTSTVLAPHQRVWLRNAIAHFRAGSEDDFVKRNSGGYCTSLDDPRLQERDIERMLSELGYTRNNGTFQRIGAQRDAANAAPPAQPASTPQNKRYKGATKSQREYIDALLALAGLSLAEACARAQVGPFADTLDDALGKEQASRLIDLLKPLGEQAESQRGAAQQTARIVAQATASLSALSERERTALLTRHNARMESLSAEQATAILREMATRQAQSAPRAGFGAPLNAPELPIDTGDAHIPATEGDEAPF